MNPLDGAVKGMFLGLAFCLCAGWIEIGVKPLLPTKADAAVMQRCLDEKRPMQECLTLIEVERILRAGK